MHKIHKCPSIRKTISYIKKPDPRRSPQTVLKFGRRAGRLSTFSVIHLSIKSLCVASGSPFPLIVWMFFSPFLLLLGMCFLPALVRTIFRFTVPGAEGRSAKYTISFNVHNLFTSFSVKHTPRIYGHWTVDCRIPCRGEGTPPPKLLNNHIQN